MFRPEDDTEMVAFPKKLFDEATLQAAEESDSPRTVASLRQSVEQEPLRRSQVVSKQPSLKDSQAISKQPSLKDSQKRAAQASQPDSSSSSSSDSDRKVTTKKDRKDKMGQKKKSPYIGAPVRKDPNRKPKTDPLLHMLAVPHKMKGSAEEYQETDHSSESEPDKEQQKSGSSSSGSESSSASSESEKDDKKEKKSTKKGEKEQEGDGYNIPYLFAKTPVYGGEKTPSKKYGFASPAKGKFFNQGFFYF